MDGKVIVKTSGRMVDTSKCFNLGHSWQGPFFFRNNTSLLQKDVFWVKPLSPPIP